MASYVTFCPQHQRWQTHRPIPPRFQAALGLGYMPSKPLLGAPRIKTPTAKGLAIQEAAPHRQKHDELFAWLGTRTAAELADLEAKGGWKGMQERSEDFAFYAHDTRQRIAAMGEQVSVGELRKAERDEEAYLAKAQEARAVVLKAEPKVAPPSADGLLALIHIWVERMGRKSGKGSAWDGRQSNHVRCLERFIAFLPANTTYPKVTPDDVFRWSEQLAKESAHMKHAGTVYIRDNLSRVGALFSAAQKKRLILVNPFANMLPEGPENDAEEEAKMKAPLPAEIRRLFETAERIRWGKKRHEYAMWFLSVVTHGGFRPSEIANLRKPQVYRNADGVPVISILFGKNKRSSREYPLLPAVEGFVDFAAACPTDRIFEGFVDDHEKEKGLEAWFSDNFTRLRRAAGLPDGRTLYGLRHAHAREIKRAKYGVKESWAEYLTGHAPKGVFRKIYRNPDELLEMYNHLVKVNFDPTVD